MIKHRTPAPTHRRSAGGLTAYLISAFLSAGFAVTGHRQSCMIVRYGL